MEYIDKDFNKIEAGWYTYYEANREMTHHEALELAKHHGLRVLDCWELHKLYLDSKEFRESLARNWYWSASLYPNNSDYAIQFCGILGLSHLNSHNTKGLVRCVIDYGYAKYCQHTVHSK
jgi:hypothetical protein